MKFENLNSSIYLSREESPSLSTAFDLIDALFKDFAAESGTELSALPFGDDAFPTRLIWLFRLLLKIYSDRTDDFVRNRARLDNMVSQVREKEAELDALSEVCEKLQDSENRLQELQAQYADTLQKHAQYENICADCEQWEQKLLKLSNFDQKAAEQRLDKLKNTVTETEQQQEKLKADLSNYEIERLALEKQCADWQKKADAASASRDNLQNRFNNLQTKFSQDTAYSTSLTEQMDSIQAENTSLSELLDTQTLKRDQLLSEKERLEGSLEATEQAEQALTSACVALHGQVQTLENTIADLTKEKQEAEKLLQEKKQVSQDIQDVLSSLFPSTPEVVREELLADRIRLSALNEIQKELQSSTETILSSLNKPDLSKQDTLSHTATQLEQLERCIGQLQKTLDEYADRIQMPLAETEEQ